MNKKGQITTASAIIVATIGLIGSVVTANITANSNVNEKISDVENKVDVIEERENNHYLEIQKTLKRIEGKIDQTYGYNQ